MTYQCLVLVEVLQLTDNLLLSDMWYEKGHVFTANAKQVTNYKVEEGLSNTD